MKIDYVSFPKRLSRAKYIAEKFPNYLKGKVLDVGCDEAPLKTMLEGVDYLGVDIGGKPDITLNLEECEKLPFSDGEFDCVLCSDVLEHINNIHHIFGELVRVSRKYVIISLPNNWVNARKPLKRGKGSFSHYGLPVDPVVDRHKWFFNLSDAKAFIEGQRSKYPFEIESMHVCEKPRSSLLRTFRRLRYPNCEKYLNLYSHTLWTVLRVS